MGLTVFQYVGRYDRVSSQVLCVICVHSCVCYGSWHDFFVKQLSILLFLPSYFI